MLDWKKYLVSVIMVFVVCFALSYLIHELLLAGDYTRQLGLWRTQTEVWKRMPLAYFAQLIFALAFCFIYTKGVEAGKHWLGQGLRYGLLVSSLMFVPLALVLYVIAPLALGLALKWVVFGYGQMLVLGAVVAALYRPPAGLPHP